MECLEIGVYCRFFDRIYKIVLQDVSSAVAFLMSMSQVDKDIDERIAQKTNFKVFQHRLGFHGLCRDCQS